MGPEDHSVGCRMRVTGQKVGTRRGDGTEGRYEKG